ncbi:GNAT family N-acetyltransferase [Weissella confusa]|uniref:GNAT family N-acetyltransferase n=1 Tax=Weissella confusa TaxID=1583 RepID=UPI0022E8F1B3|nr:GNAT family protein [Weissella confusa]
MGLMEKLANLESFESSRLFFRHATEQDAADMFELFHNPEVLKWIHAPMPASVEDTLENTIRGYHMSNPLGKYVMVQKSSGKVIGSFDIRPVEKQNLAEIGYALNKDYWGKGIMTEALIAGIKIGFETLGLNRIQTDHAPENIGSGRVMEKAGMQYEGTLRQFERLPNGQYVDSKIYSILSSDYFATK